MPQVFQPRQVLFIKLLLIGLLSLSIVSILAWHWSNAEPIARFAPVEQVIPFSHKHHVGDEGIDCRYCHTSVERSRFAGLPSTDICLSCHSQLFRDAPLLRPLHESASSGRAIAWNRVHDLPDFVYFDHSIHVAKGVSCSECHGPVDQMPLTWRHASLQMQWCLACHRDPLPHIHRAAATPANGEAALHPQAALLSERRRTDCSTCHR
jgi:hypothetical protein